MGQAGRFGQAAFGCAAKSDFDSVFQKAFVAYGDEDRLDVGAGPEHCPDSLVLRILCVR